MIGIRRFLICIALSVAMAELLLAAFDPLGVVYFSDQRVIADVLQPDPSGYAFRPGTLQLSHWSFRILPDGTRAVPGTADSGIRIDFYGDSVTFGYGVDDSETWISKVCATLAVACRNVGRSGYAASNIAALLRDVPGCAVVLTIPNDVERPVSGVSRYEAPRPFAVLENIYWIGSRVANRAETRADWDGYRTAMDSIANRPNTLLLAFDDGSYGDMVREQYGAVQIAPYTRRISYFDSHPNAWGNREIADAAAPVIAEWLDGRDCGGGDGV